MLRTGLYCIINLSLSLVPQHPALYQYQAISTILPNMSSLVNVNPRITLFQAYPQLQTYVWGAIEQAIKDLIRPVAERAMKIALTTAEHIIKKVPTYCPFYVNNNNIMRSMDTGYEISPDDDLITGFLCTLKYRL